MVYADRTIAGVAMVLIVAFTVAIMYYFRREASSNFSSGYTLQSSPDDSACQDCISTHQNDKKNLCTCLKNNRCDKLIALYCKGNVDEVSDCDNCNLDYAKCMSDNNDFKKCRADLCDCLKKNNCDETLTQQTCAELPEPEPSNATSCLPSNGNWTKDGGGLNSPCCQPPDYKIHDSSYKTCQNYKEESDPTIRACLENTCKYVASQSAFYDPSWTPMGICASSLCCYNFKNPHFKKFGTCPHYISGDPAEATAPDSQEAGTSGDWRGWIGWN